MIVNALVIYIELLNIMDDISKLAVKEGRYLDRKKTEWFKAKANKKYHTFNDTSIIIAMWMPSWAF